MVELRRASEQEEDFIEGKFAEYYEEALKTISLPSSLERREFGFIPFREKTMIRHKEFKTPEAFAAFVRSITPSHAYYSAAYYEKPEESMERKGWLGADLVFDIDSDHIETSCKGEHECWICEDCQNATAQQSPVRCPKCGSSKMKEESWLCETCLETAKAETIKLLDFLMVDFGFQQKEVETCFSGHRGYHVHVEGEGVKLLDQAARKEIVDYLLGTGLKIEYHGLAKTTGRADRRMIGPDLADSGWRGRIAKGVYDVLLSATPQQLEEIEEFNKADAQKVALNRERILEVWSKRAPWEVVKGIGPKTWEKLARHGIKKQAPKIDTVVTTDIHRLIRIPQTLHGKTGLKVVSIASSSLEKFDPLKDAIAFPKGSLEVYIDESYEFRLGDETFGPYSHEKVELPTAAGVYLICKKVAKISQDNLHIN